MEIRQLVEAVDPLGPRSSNFSIMLKALGDFVKVIATVLHSPVCRTHLPSGEASFV